MVRTASLSPLLLALALALAISVVSAASNSNPHSLIKKSKDNSLHRRAVAAASRAHKDDDSTHNKNSTSTAKTSTSTAKSSKASASSTAAAAKGGDLVGDSSDKNFTLSNLPKTWQDGQTGTNLCTKWGKSSQDSMCQTAFINSLDDFCLWAPPTPGSIGETERLEVAWCMKEGYGTRLIPSGAIQAAHFLQTKEYVQITGTGDLTYINVPSGDQGGELDPHGADGNGNPIGGLVFSNAFDGKYQQIHEWMMFVSDTEYCFRACKGRDRNAQNLCQHIYDTMGCEWVMPGNYGTGFDSCDGDVALPPGIVGTSTFTQGDAVTPSASPAPATSKCTSTKSLKAAITVSHTAILTTASSAAAASGTSNVVAAAAGAKSSSTAATANGAGDVRPLLAMAVSMTALVAFSLVLI